MANDKLFQLIESLTKSEKRYFKLFSKKTNPLGEKNYLKLFDTLEGLDKYEETILIKKLKEQYQIASEQEMPGIQVIEQAYPAERKIKPVRSRIVISTTLITFFFAMLGALLVEEVRFIKEQL